MTPDARPIFPSALHLEHAGCEVTLEPGAVFAVESDDTYHDTPAAVMVQIIAEIERGHPWREVVATRYQETNPWLHKIVTSTTRDRFFRLHPPPPGSFILDLGAGWGQLALPFARDHFVCVLEPTPERLQFIQAAARQEGLANRMAFVQANFLSVAFRTRFDLVTCVGVLEWVPRFAQHLDSITAQLAFLRGVRATLTPGGQLVIGIENRLGLKYLLGARDDHTGLAGVSVLDHALANRRMQERGHGLLANVTHTESEYRDLLASAGFHQIEFFAAFPDYKLPEIILPCEPRSSINTFFLDDGFCPEHDGFDGSPLPAAFQEELRSHYRSLAALGIAPAFSPSFFIVAS